MDRGAWQTTVHGVPKSLTQLSTGACVCTYTHTHSWAIDTFVVLFSLLFCIVGNFYNRKLEINGPGKRKDDLKNSSNYKARKIDNEIKHSGGETFRT